MDEKKEIQQTITSQKGGTSEEEFYSVLKLISPGTNLRKALDGMVSSGRGALIVVEKPALYKIIDGGFRVNCKFSYQKLVELSKMDGAIILSNDLKKISVPCFYCSADSDELKLFLILVIGGLVLCSIFIFLGLYIKGHFKNTEDLNDYPLKVEQKNDNGEEGIRRI